MKIPVDLQIVSLNRAHLSGIETLLQICGLPYEDCSEHLNTFNGITRDGNLVAIGALQINGPVALLRSIAVHPENRNQGLAAIITQYLLELARLDGVRELYLLTETAENYFTRFGFCPVGRENLPAGIKLTRQFESLCPASAQAMRLKL